MSKRTIGIIVAAVLLVGFIALLWLWYLGRQQEIETPGANQNIGSNTPVGAGGGIGGYSSDVTVSPGGVAKTVSVVTTGPGPKANSINAIFSAGTYSPGSNSYTLSGGVYNSATNSYTVSGAVVTGGVYNSANNTYTVSGGVYSSPNNTYTAPIVSTYTVGGTGTNSGPSGSPLIVDVGPGTPGNPYNPGGPGTGSTTSVTIVPQATTTTPVATTTPVVIPPAVVPPVAPIGAVWIPDTGGPFIPTAINNINDSNPNGNGSIFFPTPVSVDGTASGPSAIEGIIAAAAVGVVTCAFIYAISTAALESGATPAASILAGNIAADTAAVTAKPTSVPVQDMGVNAQTSVANVALSIIAGAGTSDTAMHAADANRDDIWSCLARKAARIVLQQMTVSVVNWINSGFHGKPSFVQNYQQFFANVADQAAGSFIQGTGLAFLCSPFSLQIKIAVALSYAQRNNAPICTLTKVIGNVNSFMKGNFSAGGWPGLVSFTAVPTNNPFGAYAAASIALNSYVATAKGNAANTISSTGFIGLQKVNSCPNSRDGPNPAGNIQVTSSSNAKVGCPAGCDCSITTPGSVISDALGATNQSTFDAVNLSKSFDEIISALISQLVVKTLRNGLSSLSNDGAGYGADLVDPAQAQAAKDARDLLDKMQSSVSIAQQYAQIQQSEIVDIQESQAQLHGVANCFNSASTTSALSADKQATAKAAAEVAKAKILSLQVEVDAHNDEITKVNAAIAMLQQLQSQLLSASTPADVASVKANYDAALASGGLYTAADITTLQQDRTTLQSRLNALNQDTNTKLSQCYALSL